MKPLPKIAVVAGGYVVAFVLASAAVAVRVAGTSGPTAQASSGMYAFGDSVLFVGVFGLCALVPTGAALFFLRSYPRFWVTLSALAVALAVTGITATGLFAVGRHATAPSPLAFWGALSVLRILVAPLLALAFLVCTAFSPSRRPRLAFIAATAIEAAVSLYGGAVWFIPMLLQRS
jgi:hypothetical protein